VVTGSGTMHRLLIEEGIRLRTVFSGKDLRDFLFTVTMERSGITRNPSKRAGRYLGTLRCYEEFDPLIAPQPLGPPARPSPPHTRRQVRSRVTLMRPSAETAMAARSNARR